MLQIVQGMYFRAVPLTNKLHRRVYYTNLSALHEKSIDLMFGRLLPSSNSDGVATLTVEAKEQLEAINFGGGREILSATTGDQLLDEIAAVIAFCLNATCVRDHDLARRLIATHSGEEAIRRGPASLLRQTFDARVMLTEGAVTDLDHFLRALVALKRDSYEASLRAIRQIVDATLLVYEDASLAYTLMVAALESLGQATKPTEAKWSEYDAQKRRRIDLATEELDSLARDRIRAAVLANEHLGLQRRFTAFVLDHVEPSFYRADALGSVLPIGATDLPNALRQAYAIRSRNVHALEELAREIWMTPHRADTTLLDIGVVLSLEGLARLSRHVIRRFVERAPKEIDSAFNYRSALPGIIMARLAPQYWIHNPNGFSPKTAPQYFDGMLHHVIEVGSKGSETRLTDMTAILDNIEKSVLGFSKSQDRLFMAGIITLWNATAPQALRRNLKPKLAKRLNDDLAEPSMVSFALAVVLGRPIEWPTETLAKLAANRREERLGNQPAPMPARIDAVLNLVLSDRLLQQGRTEEATKQLGHAVETVPGLLDLIKFEEAIRHGEAPCLILDRFVFGENKFVDF